MRQMLQKYNGLLTMKLKVPIYYQSTLSLVYTPGVGAACLKIQENWEDLFKYTNYGNSIALVTDCSKYKSFGKANWISDAAIPQLEAQCLFYKLHCNIDAYPFIIDSKLCQTEEQYLEILDGLGCSFAGVEIFNTDCRKYNNLLETLK